MSELREQVRDRYTAAAKAVEDGHAATDWDEVAGCADVPDDEIFGANIRATKA